MNIVHKRISLRVITVACLLWTVIYSSGFLYTQEPERKVSGTITDQSGKPLIGVTIMVKGTTKGTVSDIDGKYAIKVPESAILHFSYIGVVSQDIVIVNQSVIDVVMNEELFIEPAKPVNLTGEQLQKVNADNGFAFKMFREVSKLQGSNTFFSPFSLHMAMGMLYNGASRKTRAEMAKILNVASLPESESNEYYHTISQEFLEIDPTTEVTIANAIWCHNSFKPKETFIEIGRKYFDAAVESLDFNNPRSPDMINSWCSNKTKGRINHILSNLHPKDRMILTNTIYFKSKWEKNKKFDRDKTKPDDFTKSDHKKSRVNMMEQTTSLLYYADQYLQCVEIPYGNKAFSMTAVLPPENGNIDQLVEYLSTAQWSGVLGNMKEERVWLKMPRFKIECELPLNQPLKNAGMGQIFKGGFTNIVDEDSLSVSGIHQKTFVEVNEEGTETAAVTAMIVAYGTKRTLKEPVRFFADRPFLFLIRERSTGIILFIGRIDDPQE